MSTVTKLYSNPPGTRGAGSLEDYLHDNCLLVSDQAMRSMRYSYRHLRKDGVSVWFARAVLWRTAFDAYLGRDKTKFVSYTEEFPS